MECEGHGRGGNVRSWRGKCREGEFEGQRRGNMRSKMGTGQDLPGTLESQQILPDDY